MTAMAIGLFLGSGQGGSLLSRLLAVPGLVAAYDVADTSSMYQGGAGNSSAGAIGSPVFWMLDQAELAGKTVGQYLDAAPNMLSNGDFSGGVTTGWSAVNATLSVVGGRLRVTNTSANFGRAEQTVTTVPGRAYLLKCDAYVGTASVARVNVGTATAGAQYGQLLVSVSGADKHLAFVATGTTAYIGLWSDNVSGTYNEGDNFSLRELPSILATAPSTTRRPTLHSGPYLDFDGVDDLLNANIVTGLGSSCSVYHRTQAGDDVWLDAQTINSGNYALSTTDWGRAAIFSSLPSDGDKLVVQAWGAAYPTPPFEDGFLALYADFENDEFSAAGAPETLAAWTDNGDATFTRTTFPDFYRSASFDNAVTMTIEYKMTSLTAAGIPFHMSAGATNEACFRINTGADDARQMYNRYNGTSYATPRYAWPEDGGTPPCLGRRRSTVTWVEGDLPWGLADNFIPREETVQPGVPTIGAPTKMTVGKDSRNIDPNVPVSGCEVCKVMIHAGFAAPADMRAIHRLGEICPPIHILGDSFNNNNRITDAWNLRTMDRGWIAWSADPVGGSTVADQWTRFLEYIDDYQDCTLAWIDGGLTDSAATVKANFDAAMAALPHQRILYFEPGPLRDDTAPERAAWDAKVAEIKAHIGARWVDTLGPICNTDAGAGVIFHDGSAEDLADIAAGLWPRSLCVSSEDFHPNAVENSAGWSGAKALAYLGDVKAVALGYIPAA